MIELIRTGQPLSFRQRLWLTVQLSWPAIMAQLSSILMQYIDAAMVGRLGADDSAAVGLVFAQIFRPALPPFYRFFRWAAHGCAAFAAAWREKIAKKKNNC